MAESLILERIAHLQERQREVRSKGGDYNDPAKQFMLSLIQDELDLLWRRRRAEKQHCIEKAAPLSKRASAGKRNAQRQKVQS